METLKVNTAQLPTININVNNNINTTRPIKQQQQLGFTRFSLKNRGGFHSIKVVSGGGGGGSYQDGVVGPTAVEGKSKDKAFLLEKDTDGNVVGFQLLPKQGENEATGPDREITTDVIKKTVDAGGKEVKGKAETKVTFNIVFVTSEAAPYSKTGGLGDVCGSLPIALAGRGHRVMVVSPRYQNGTAADKKYAGALDADCRIKLCCFEGEHEVAFFHEFRDGVDWVFVDHPAYHRPGNPYGDSFGAFGDNQFRFTLLCHAACEAPLVLPLGGYTYGEKSLFLAANKNIEVSVSCCPHILPLPSQRIKTFKKRSPGFGPTAPSVRATNLKLLEQNPDCAAMRDLRHYLISEFFAVGTHVVFFNRWTKIFYPI